MTLLETVHILETVAAAQPSVAQIVPNDVFRLNTLPDARYGVFAWTQQEHRYELDDDFHRFSFVLYYVDRLTADKGNELEIQSVGVATLENILQAVADRGVALEDTASFTTFNQRFLDECAGVFCRATFIVPVAGTCADDYIDEPEPEPGPIPEPSDYDSAYLTIRALDDGVLSVNTREQAVDYSVNEGLWLSISKQDTPTSIIVGRWDIVSFRGTGGGKHLLENNTLRCKAWGNTMSLVWGDDFAGKTDINKKDLRHLFSGCTGLEDARNVILPALSGWEQYSYAYMQMFGYCSALVYGPKVLPALKVPYFGYMNMFYGCTGLTAAPDILATDLTQQGCCHQMFYKCAKLARVKCLAASIGYMNCTTRWLEDVAASGVFVRNPSYNWTRGVNGVPDGWTIIDNS